MTAVAIRRLRLGTRASALALVQSRAVAAALGAAHPGTQVDLVEISTLGDRTQHTNRPAENWGQGVFVKELERALLEDAIDLAVHSLKDVPPAVPETLRLAAVPRRADPRDALVTTDGRDLKGLPEGVRVGTSSARRAAFLRALRPDLRFLPIRGNVDTRWRKLVAGEYDAILLACAGLERLGLQVPAMPLDPAVLPPAPGQGALAIETRAADAPTLALVQALDHRPTAVAVAAERRVMEALEGGCRLPVAALATPSEDEEALELLGAVAAADGSRVLRAQVWGPLARATDLADEVVASLRAQGAAALMGPA